LGITNGNSNSLAVFNVKKGTFTVEIVSRG